MNIIIDMNLPPAWVAFFEHHEHQAMHWSTVGDARATDHSILSWARARQYVVFTHDLDFSAILAATQADGPSVLQVRTQDVTPDYLGELVLTALQQFAAELDAGALVTVDERSLRARILPFTR